MNKLTSLLIVALFFQTSLAFCDISLPKLISDGAILQRDVELKIWGWASPGEGVAMVFNDNSYQTVTDSKGNWQINLPAQKAGGPFQMTFAGNNELVVKNILFGDVWLCSGQSNMELTMQRVKDNYPEEIKASHNSNIRQFLVPDQYDFKKVHKDLDDGPWMEANQDNIYNFSAVAYFFAKDLYAKYHVPIGLINAALGGSPVEAWMSEDALKPFPYAYDELQKFKDDRLIEEIETSDRQRIQAWFSQLNSGDLGLSKGAEWFKEQIDESTWKNMEVPGFWEDNGLPSTDGVVWFRKKIIVPKSMIGKEVKLWLGRMVDQDSVFVNGTFVGTIGYQYPPRKYVIEPNILKEGENTIAIRLINQQGQGGFIKDKPYFLAVQNDTIDLKGTWKFRLGKKMDPLEGPTFVRWKPGGLYNKMVAPLLNYNMKGVIWYQGESNAGNPETYFETFPALISNWRSKWNIGDFPFIYVQLANFMEETDQPVESDWAELRQAQLNTLSVPNTGMVVTIDIGEWNDIHPLNKKEVGKRLATQARSLAYHEMVQDGICPVPSNHKLKKGKIEISFDHVGKGLMSRFNEPLRHFAISEDGENFVWARARIKGDKVIVWSDKVKNPIAVRYAWADNPASANLVTVDGLPASPFEVRSEK